MPNCLKSLAEKPYAQPLPISYTIEGARRASGLGRSTLYTLMAEGRLTKVKVNGRTLITAASLLALISGGD